MTVPDDGEGQRAGQEGADGYLTYSYIFTFKDGSSTTFGAKLALPGLSLVHKGPEGARLPEWTRLDFNRCTCCPLDPAVHTHCPVALSLSTLVDSFSDAVSFDEVEVCIETAERTYLKRTSLQAGVSSMLGIFMVSSGCPVMEKLKPMVRFHLPFATLDETIYRALSMYLMAQYFIYQRGGTPDWELRDLARIYEDVGEVNSAFAKRLKSVVSQDANVNALVILDVFADNIRFSIDGNVLDDMEELFRVYLPADSAGDGTENS